MTDAERIAKLEAEREKDKRTIEDLVAAERAADGVLEASEARCRELEGALRRVLNDRCCEHEDACCDEWCQRCQQELASREVARAALAPSENGKVKP